MRLVGLADGNIILSSIQINHNPVVALQEDKNIGFSVVASFGTFSEGDLVTDGEVKNIYPNHTVIDGQRGHYVTLHKGDRWSIIHFLNNKWEDMPDSDIKFLTKVEFQLQSHEVQITEHKVEMRPDKTKILAFDIAYGFSRPLLLYGSLVWKESPQLYLQIRRLFCRLRT